MSDEDESRCRFGGKRKDNGNCENPSEDGLPAQSVGAWARKKHERIQLYIEATRAVRAKYLPPNGQGGAAFIDLFAGPGRARIRDQAATIPGSALIALEHGDAPFSRVLLCDLDPENVEALRARTTNEQHRVEVLEGDCNAEIDRILALVPPHGLNIALIDPFGPKPLRWSTLAKLGSVKRMDLLIHFPTGSIKRNFYHSGFDQTIDEMLGTTTWRGSVRSAEHVPKLIDVLQGSSSDLDTRANA
jgi:three-Cys-motif partner protein